MALCWVKPLARVVSHGTQRTRQMWEFIRSTRAVIRGSGMVSWWWCHAFFLICSWGFPRCTRRVKLGTHAQTGEQYALKFLRKESSAAAASVFKQVSSGAPHRGLCEWQLHTDNIVSTVYVFMYALI